MQNRTPQVKVVQFFKVILRAFKHLKSKQQNPASWHCAMNSSWCSLAGKTRAKWINHDSYIQYIMPQKNTEPTYTRKYEYRPLVADPVLQLLWGHSSYCSLGLRLQEATHPAWNMPSQSWRWYPTHKPKINVFYNIQ